MTGRMDKKKNGFWGADRMAKQVKTLTAKPDGMSLIPRIHMVGENGLHGVVLCLWHMHKK